MTTNTHTMHSIAQRCFAWVMPSDAPTRPTPSDGLDSPVELAELVNRSALTEPEAQTLWCYLQILGEIDPALVAKAAALSAALRTTTAFESATRPVLLRAVRNCVPKPNPTTLLDNPPTTIISTITDAVIQAHFRSERRLLRGLRSAAFEHASDRAVLSKFRALPGVDTIFGKFMDFIHKRPQEMSLIAGSIRVTHSSLPWLHDCFAEACATLDIKEPPELFVTEGGINAYTTGVRVPMVVVQTGAVNLMDRQEMLYVLGHELGHVLAGHVKYGMLANWIVGAASAASVLTFGLSGIVADATILSALYAWMRRSEFTADRAGLLVCQDREAVLRALMKMTGYPMRFYGSMQTRAIIEQVAFYKEKLANNSIDRMFDLNDVWGQGHPRAMMRAAELLDWIDDGSYDEILQAGPDALRTIATRAQEDPALHELFMVANRELVTWASQNFNVPKTIAGPIVRKMLGEQQSPAGTPFEAILHVELQTVKVSANEIAINLIFLVNDAGRAKRTTLPLPFDSAWDGAPAAIREELIRSGSHELTRLLYTCKSSS